MNSSPASYHRKRARSIPAIITLVLGIVILCLSWAVVRLISSPSPSRQSTVIVGDVVYVVSWDAPREHVVVVEIPSAAVIEGVYGYGKYSLQSLRSLDSIDGRKGALFVESISDAFGVPLVGYTEIASSLATESSIDLLRRVFSWKSLFAPTGNHHGVSWGTWASWVIATRYLKADQVDVIQAKHALVEQAQPDGSLISFFDMQRFDYLYGQAFLDTRIRTEGITVSVYNTTSVPTLGQRAARMLSQIGISVVTVGNDEAALSGCVLSGTEESLGSYTAGFIHAYFHCQKKENTEAQGSSDLSLQLGTDYASIFAPRK